MNETGYSQIVLLARWLSAQLIDAIYSSPMRRTLSTASILAKPHNITPTIIDNLAEIDFGEWQGLHASEIQLRWQTMWQQWRTDPLTITLPRGESFHQVTTRSIQVFEQVIENASDNGVVLVSHDSVIKAIIAHILGVPASIYRRIRIDNASCTIIQFEYNKPVITVLNATSHLDSAK